MPGVSTSHNDSRWGNICKLLRMGYSIQVSSGWFNTEYVHLGSANNETSDEDIKKYLLSKNFNIDTQNGIFNIKHMNDKYDDYTFNVHDGNINYTLGYQRGRYCNVNNLNSGDEGIRNAMMLNYFAYISQHNSSHLGVKKTLAFLNKSKSERFLQPEELSDIVQELYYNISRFPAHTQEAQIATEMANKFIETYVSKMNITDYEKMNHINESLYVLIDRINIDNKKFNTKVMEFANVLRGEINKKLNANLPQITPKNINNYNVAQFPYFAKSQKSTCGSSEDVYECTVKNVFNNISSPQDNYYIEIIKESLERNDTTKLGTLINVWQKLNPGVNCVQENGNKLRIFGTEVTFNDQQSANPFKQYLNHVVSAKLPYIIQRQKMYKGFVNERNSFSLLDPAAQGQPYGNSMEDYYRDKKYKIYGDSYYKESQDIIMYELLRQYIAQNQEPNKNKMYKDLTQENKKIITDFINEYKIVKPLLQEDIKIDLEHCRTNGYSVESIFASQKKIKEYLDTKFNDVSLLNIVSKFVDQEINNIDNFNAFVDISVITNAKNINGTTDDDIAKKKLIIFEGILDKIRSGDKAFIDAIKADANGLKVGGIDVVNVTKEGQAPNENDYKLLKECLIRKPLKLVDLEKIRTENRNTFSCIDHDIGGCEPFPKKFVSRQPGKSNGGFCCC